MSKIPYNFNPRSRVGSDRCILSHTRGNYISIHAPAWGATFDGIGGFPYIWISIHAPAWGATA